MNLLAGGDACGPAILQGIEGVYMALMMCEHTNIYGFDVNHMEGFPYHYFDAFKGTGSAHSFKFQSLFLKMLVSDPPPPPPLTHTHTHTHTHTIKAAYLQLRQAAAMTERA